MRNGPILRPDRVEAQVGDGEPEGERGASLPSSEIVHGCGGLVLAAVDP